MMNRYCMTLVAFFLFLPLTGCGAGGGSLGSTGSASSSGGEQYVNLNSASVSSSALTRGGELTFSWNADSYTVTGGYRIEFFFSADQTYDDGDTEIGATNCLMGMGGITGCGSSGDGQVTKTVPSRMAAGTYYVLISTMFYNPDMSENRSWYVLNGTVAVN